jgi:hypothetical protein
LELQEVQFTFSASLFFSYKMSCRYRVHELLI